MKRFTVNNNPNYSVTVPKLLYIDRYGNIYPDCKTYKTDVICHITDLKALEKINRAVFGTVAGGIFNMITVEVSSACQANCVYCFQRDGHRNDKYAYYDYLLSLLGQLEAYWIFFSGGEILIQKDAMDFIRKYKEKNPHTWVHLKTNGNAEMDLIPFVLDTCDSVMVSFNGFSAATYKTIMNLDIEKTMRFCMKIREAGKTNLGLKLLNSPITIAETPDFLEWALSLSPRCIALQTAYNYEVETSGKSHRLSSTLPSAKSSFYWNDVYGMIARRCDDVLAKYSGKINEDRNYLTADKEILQLLPLSPSNMKLFRTDGVYIIE